MGFSKGDKVKDRFSNVFGTLTGKTKADYAGMTYCVELDNGTLEWWQEKFMLPVPHQMDMYSSFKTGNMKNFDEFRRLMTYLRVRGELTNVFYSMHIGNTIFLPHQYLPVQKFINSPYGKLLIADEVGLGKTIEALYIWKELQARYYSNKLLIVCPASLMEKWQGELYSRFRFKSEIVNAKTLLEIIRNPEWKRFSETRVLIGSIEGLRCNIEKGANDSWSYKLNKFIKDKEEEGDSFFDLMIIDEAHYLRNSSTASFKTGRRLGNVSNYQLLLSATPVQTSQDNLFNLLNLLVPDYFDDRNVFQNLIEENSNLTHIANTLLSLKGLGKKDYYFRRLLSNNSSFKADLTIRDLYDHWNDVIISNSKRIEYYYKIKSLFFYDRFVSRTRKREADIKLNVRKAFTISFSLSLMELKIYNQISELIKKEYFIAKKNKGLTLALIVRQRQMASCMPAAFEQWFEYKKCSMESANSKSVDQIIDEETPWDLICDENEDVAREVKIDIIKDFDPEIVKRLRDNDSKYRQFLNNLKKLLGQENGKKIIVFSFFRNTVKYLCERLNQDGINAIHITGGMGIAKESYIDDFKNDSSINVLVSSEVGSEGIDLQFASIEINYDLPWNPMRLEQRIGRIDRIGQKSPSIQVHNVICSNTIEDRVLQRLYENLDLFENSIGGLEEILGETVTELTDAMMDLNLNAKQLIEKADQEKIALEAKRKMEDEIQKGDFSEQFRDSFIRDIKSFNAQKRYVSGRDLITFVRDYFVSDSFGNSLEEMPSGDKDCAVISLSINEKKKLRKFIEEKGYEPSILTSEIYPKVSCYFGSLDKKAQGAIQVIDINHPLIRYIFQRKSEKQALSTAFCLCLSKKQVSGEDVKIISSIETGIYAFIIREMEQRGSRKVNELKYYAMKIGGKFLTESESESLAVMALYHGESENGYRRFINQDEVNKCFDCCIDKSDVEIDEAMRKNDEENTSFIDRRIDSITREAKRRIASIRRNIEDIEMNNPDNPMIKLNKGKIDKKQKDLEERVASLQRDKEIPSIRRDICAGVIRVL